MCVSQSGQIQNYVCYLLPDLAGGSPSVGMDGRNLLLGLLLSYGAWKASQYSVK